MELSRTPQAGRNKSISTKPIIAHLCATDTAIVVIDLHQAKASSIVTDTPPELKAARRAIYDPPHLIVEIASGNWSDDLKRRCATTPYCKYRSIGWWIIAARFLRKTGGGYASFGRGKGVKTIVLRLNGYRYKRQEYLDEAIEYAALGLRLTTNAIVAA